MAIYKRMHKLGFDHLVVRTIHVKIRSEIDRIMEPKFGDKRLKEVLADEVIGHKPDGRLLAVV